MPARSSASSRSRRNRSDHAARSIRSSVAARSPWNSGALTTPGICSIRSGITGTRRCVLEVADGGPVGLGEGGVVPLVQRAVAGELGDRGQQLPAGGGAAAGQDDRVQHVHAGRPGGGVGVEAERFGAEPAGQFGVFAFPAAEFLVHHHGAAAAEHQRAFHVHGLDQRGLPGRRSCPGSTRSGR